MNDIIIEVRGGVVQCVTTTGDNVRAVIVDWDDIAEAQGDEKKLEWTKLDAARNLEPDTRELYERLLSQ